MNQNKACKKLHNFFLLLLCFVLFSITNIYNSKNKDAFILEVNLHIVHVVFRNNLNICLKFNKIIIQLVVFF